MNIFNGSSYEYICWIQAGWGGGKKEKIFPLFTSYLWYRVQRRRSAEERHPAEASLRCTPDFRKKCLVYGTNTILSCRFLYQQCHQRSIKRGLGTPRVPVLEQHGAPGQWQLWLCEALALVSLKPSVRTWVTIYGPVPSLCPHRAALRSWARLASSSLFITAV